MTTHPSDLELWTGAAAPHLSGCERCAARVTEVSAEQREVAERLAATMGGPLAVPPAVEQRVARALAEQEAQRSGDLVVMRPRRRGWVAAAGLAAAAVVVAGVVVPRVVTSVSVPTTDSAAEADGGAAREDGGGDDPLAPQTVAPPLPADVASAAQALVAAGPGATAGVADACGAALAADVGGTVLAAGPAAGGDGVLVVVRTDDVRTAWWLPTCEALPGAALGASALP